MRGKVKVRPRRVELGHFIGYDEAFGCGERGRVGEEAGGVAVGAHAEQDQVEARQLAGAGCRVGGDGFAHGTLVGGGGRVRVTFAGEADDHAWGVALVRERVEEGLLGHAVVAVGRGGRHAALVAPEDLPARPVEVFASCEGGVDGTRGGAAGEGDAKEAALADGYVGGRGYELLGDDGKVGGGGDDFDLLAGAAHSMAPV